MSWKDILKVELPPKVPAGTPVDPERNRAMDEWAKEYEQKLLNQLNGELGSYIKFDGSNVSFEGFSNPLPAMPKSKFVNEVKGWVRDLTYNGGYNYASEIESLSKTDDFLRRISGNGNYISEFINYLKR
tara:strand:+ start:1226 stop:1612 length:387 start_codon:yes stop_codon:yes gene_type:complete